jgi:uncharacterized protein with HEPN domain
MESPDRFYRKKVAQPSIVAHDYFKVDLDIVWATIKSDLPAMRQDVQALLDGFISQDKPSLPRSRM